ncbi:hypothetical protein [Pontibacter rugosus]|uniref:Uncharacterized protein n=1 Tax=Pontibacter rugosus TaxID=1745966 RepID=A0ABW3SX02_9BACT
MAVELKTAGAKHHLYGSCATAKPSTLGASLKIDKKSALEEILNEDFCTTLE